MLEVLSLVNFDNPKRVAYLERSFGSFYRYNTRATHWVLDSSKVLGEQRCLYEKYGAQVIHQPEAPYAARLKHGLTLLKNDYFLFLPDDFAWIFDFPVERAIAECARHGIAELKLTGRGMPWYGEKNPRPQPWHENGKVMSGEELKAEGELFVSRRLWWRDFHEQFSLACNLFETRFAREIVGKIPAKVRSPGAVEKQAYVRLLFRRYATAYYKMWIPAFHFMDLSVEADSEDNRKKASYCLTEANYAIYNAHYNV